MSTVPTHDTPDEYTPVAHDAIDAIVNYAGLNASRRQVARALPHWHRFNELTAADIRDVVDSFPAAKPEPEPYTELPVDVLLGVHYVRQAANGEPVDKITALQLLHTWPEIDGISVEDRIRIVSRFPGRRG